MKKTKKILSALLCIILILGVIPCSVAQAVTVSNDPGFHKSIYLDFESGLGTNYDTRTYTGNGTNQAYAVSAEGGAVWSVSDGILNLQVTNGQWLRTWNSITDLENYRYMVVRMKGSYSGWGGTLTGNALSFKFGSSGSQTSPLTMPVDDLTSEYSYVFIEIPENYFSAAADNGYRYSLWIGTQRGAKFNVDIDEIFFTNDQPSSSFEPIEPENPSINATVYSDFIFPLAQGSPVSNGADGTITLFALEGGTQSVQSGALNLNLTGEGSYIRFTSSVPLSDGTNTKFSYMVIRIKGGATQNSSPVTGNILNFIFASWGNEEHPVRVRGDQINSSAYTDVVLALSDLNFKSSHPDYLTGLIIRNAGDYQTQVQIDTISFTDTLNNNEDYDPGDVNCDGQTDILDLVRLKKNIALGSEIVANDVDTNETINSGDLIFLTKMLLGIYGKSDLRFIYTDFSNELTAGSYVDSGEVGQKVQLMVAEDAAYATENGALNITMQGAGGYLRFLNTVPLTDSNRTAKYKYMCITVKGNAYNASGNRHTSGNLFKVWFGAWDSESKAIYVGVNQVSGSLFSKVILPLSDTLFSGIPDNYISGLFIKSAGASRTELSIDSISFSLGDPNANGVLSGDVTLYQFPGMTSSSYYDVTVGGENAFVYETNANNRHTSPRGNAWDEMDYEKIGIVSFDLTGKTEMEVSIPNLTGVTVTPSAAGIIPIIENGHARFAIRACGQYTVEFNGSHNRALHIFANEAESNPITASSSTTIYYGPGEHHVGEITLNTNQTLYLARGAVIHGYVKAASKNNIAVRGRGYFDGSDYPRYKEDGTSTAHKVPIDFYNCTNVTIQGVSCLDPAGWAYNLNRCNTVNIENIKVVTSRQNGDGISVQSCKDVFVSNSFLRTWDDTLVVKNYDGFSTDNIHFDNCQLWTDLAQSMEVGYETVGDTMSRISFSNITVLHNFHKAVISVHNADHADISDVSFQNIILEDSTRAQGDTNNYLIELQVLYSKVWSRENIRGTIDGITIDNVKVLHGSSPEIHITGYDATHRVDHVSLSNVYLPDRRISSLNDPAFLTNSYTDITVS